METHGQYISKEEIDTRFNIDLNTGVITRKYRSGKMRKGSTVGGLDKDGYLSTTINNKRYRIHRLLWFYVHGEYPKNQIDHINGNKTDNSIGNLRESTPLQNMQNIRKPLSNNKSGYLGVYLNKITNRYYSQIKKGNLRICLGYFDTPEEAYNVYLKKKREIHEFCTI